jgi:hypothetical protein
MIKYIEFALFPIFILSTHWVALQFYSTYCVSPDLLGYLISYITVSSPVCSFCLTILERTGNIYYAIWLSFSIIIIRFFTTLATNILTNK